MLFQLFIYTLNANKTQGQVPSFLLQNGTAQRLAVC